MTAREPKPITWESNATGIRRAVLGAGVRATIAEDPGGWWWQVSYPSRSVEGVQVEKPKGRSGRAPDEATAQAAALEAAALGRPT